jgi:zinc protease
VVSGTTLARNWAETLELVQEILLEPRFDSLEFELARRRVENQLQQRAANPNAIADASSSRLVYGDHPWPGTSGGTPAALAERSPWTTCAPGTPGTSTPGSPPSTWPAPWTGEETLRGLQGLGEGGAVKPGPGPPPRPGPGTRPGGRLLRGCPRGAQSVLRIGYLAMPETDPDYWPAQVMNFRLGGAGSPRNSPSRSGRGWATPTGSARASRVGVRPGPFQ